jgi:hypothetical protein
MSTESAKEVTKGGLLVLGSFAVVGIAALFAVGVGVAAGLSEGSFPVYAFAFLFGAWSAVTTTFVVNYISRRIYGSDAVSYGFPNDG